MTVSLFLNDVGNKEFRNTATANIPKHKFKIQWDFLHLFKLQRIFYFFEGVFIFSINKEPFWYLNCIIVCL